ncbi:MAG: TonB-dependent receptor [Candidatus Eremiobacteraeota bacterium]|nr:TonB-dependent receptor [Candidatus Eremiobacteraeota bacterium]
MYASLNHTYSVNRGCETQLLAPCFGSSTDWTPADHEQRWGATAGILRNDRRGGWFSADLEYGSGLSSTSCPANTVGFCKRTPHLTIDAEKAWSVAARAALIVRVRNLFNDRYFVTLQNAQGNHYAAPRTVELGLGFTGGK